MKLTGNYQQRIDAIRADPHEADRLLGEARALVAQLTEAGERLEAENARLRELLGGPSAPWTDAEIDAALRGEEK